MIIPIRCFTCGKEIANLWPIYCEIETMFRNKNQIRSDQDRSDQTERNQTHQNRLDRIQMLNEKTGLKRICCKRMLLTHVEIIDKLTQYSTLSF